MVKDLGIILDSSPHRKQIVVEKDHHAGDQKSHKAGAAPLQTRRDTTGPLPGVPDYVSPEDWPAKHIELLQKANA